MTRRGGCWMHSPSNSADGAASGAKSAGRLHARGLVGAIRECRRSGEGEMKRKTKAERKVERKAEAVLDALAREDWRCMLCGGGGKLPDRVVRIFPHWGKACPACKGTGMEHAPRAPVPRQGAGAPRGRTRGSAWVQNDPGGVPGRPAGPKAAGGTGGHPGAPRQGGRGAGQAQGAGNRQRRHACRHSLSWAL